MQKRNKTKHDQSKKHKYCSNLILKRYIIKDVEVAKYKDVIDPYFTHQSRKFNFFTVSILLGFYDGEYPLKHKINMSNYVTYNILSELYTTCTTELASGFQQRVISIYFFHRCFPKKISK